MWEINQHIQKDEKVIYEGTPDWLGYLFAFIIAFLLIFTFIFPLLIVAAVALNNKSTKYLITNKRIANRRGILSESFKSASYNHITSVHVSQGIIAKLLGIGTIVIDTAGSGPAQDFRWHFVKNPIKVKNTIEKKIN
tara:strand:- start:496 stop:906 length:411 start_codon:yes stop_codon:yes gene_type:complete